ncbi:Mitochondrial substrate carrier family protein [Euphorbia peplus]|nr:Mitochondrial substrate carrier family protein [Euphorbia peplus]
MSIFHSSRYKNGMDAFCKIFNVDGPKGLYRGFGLSILTYAPSNAVWWTSYFMYNKLVWDRIAWYSDKNDDGCYRPPDSKSMVAVQGVCATMACGILAIITMPLDTIKTRMQVLDGGIRQPLTVLETVKNRAKEGGFASCCRGLRPRWVSMSLSATTMITTYEFLKRLSTKSGV